MSIRRIILFGFVYCLYVSAAAQEIRQVKITELEKLIKERNTPLLVNFWATCCQTSVVEIPSFIREVNAHKADSLQLILVSLDLKEIFPAGIRNFIQLRNYEGRFLWLDETDADYFCPKIDMAWSGVIPASLFINNKTGYRAFFESKLTDEQLVKILTDMLPSPTCDQ